jgi:hypothetical protein
MTADSRSTAKNSLGLQGQSPVDPAVSEKVSSSNAALLISAPGGTPVRATHPGTVSSIQATGSGSYVEIIAGQDAYNRSFDSSSTAYTPLGTVDVSVGERVDTGQQIGTVSFDTFEEFGGVSGLSYSVLANQSGSTAAKRDPVSEGGLSIVQQAQPQESAPDSVVPVREAPPEAADGTKGLNQDGATKAAENPPSLDGVGVGNYKYRSRPQVKFAEQKNQVFSHNFLVFISGVDVTRYVTGSISINLVDRDGWNEANLVLNNALDNFVITLNNLGFNKDLKGRFRATDVPGEDKYSEFAKQQIIEYKNDKKRNPFVDVAKMQLVESTITQGSAEINATGKSVEASTQNPNDVSDGATTNKRDKGRENLTKADPANFVDRRWQLGFQSPVFHKHDPIRIFIKNPIREIDQWMPAFTGYLNQISYDTNYLNGLSVIKLSCYDIRALAAKMRIQETAVTGLTNPRALFQGAESVGSASLFTDLLNPTVVGNPLQSKKFEDVMEFIITGTSTQSERLNAAFGESKFRRGIGDFTVGDRILYRPGDSKTGTQPDPLEHWHALCLFGTDGREFRTGVTEDAATDEQAGKAQIVQGVAKKGLTNAFDRRWLTEAEVRTIGTNTTHDGEWAPHKQFVHFLLPAEGTGAKNLLEADAANVNSNQLDFRSRLDIMQDFAARIDYQFWVTPIGDFVVEFPMYDFYPDDFQEYKTVLQVDKHLQSDTIQDEAGDMTTAIIAHGRIRPETEAQIEEPVQPKAVVVSPMMMMRYGVIEHELTLPFISSANSLARIAQIEFQKKLAESNKMNMQFSYRPFITPNRPMEHMERKRIGLTTAVNNSITVLKEAKTTVTTRYVRRQIFRSDGTPAYTFIFSGTSMPITYREIYEPGTIEAVSNPAGSGVSLVQQPVTETSNTALPTVEDPVITQGAVETFEAVKQEELLSKSPVPSSEQSGRFMAMAQQLSGWNPFNRTEDGGFGLFNLPKDLRDATGLGDITDIGAQITAADNHFRGLVGKWQGNLDNAVAEFNLGAEKMKNADLVAEFKAGIGAVNKTLGAEFEKIAQPLIDGYNKLFPGDKEAKDTSNEAATETKKVVAAAEAAGPVPSGKGSQTTVGVLVFTTQDEQATSSTEASPSQTQATQNKVTNG